MFKAKTELIEKQNRNSLPTKQTERKRPARQRKDREITAARTSNRIANQAIIRRTNQEDEREARRLDEAKSGTTGPRR